MIRLFAAVPIPDDIAIALARRQGGVERARWSPLENLHLTLAFFGDVREDLARDLDAELLTLRGAAFDLELRGVGAFGEGPDVLWAGVVEAEPLTRLAKACESAARRVGLQIERRSYRPHVTLAYLRHPEPAEVAHWIQANNLLKSPPIRVERFGLYSSFQGSGQPYYRLETEYPLT